MKLLTNSKNIPTAAQSHRIAMGNRVNHIYDKYIKEIGGNNKLAGVGPRLGKTPGLN
ncbi:hypothetical protein [Morganella morganii]|uniref:hypothetical protein n=1 Tax=Morganella morganii TaxID=582 RepID=UPI0013B391A7|nr:hypothetical protein [Morganella morganii]